MWRLPILFLLVSCTGKAPKVVEPKKTYYIKLNGFNQILLTGKYEKLVKIDTVFALNDSLAYWSGVKGFAATKMADNRLKDAGVKNPPYYFEVFDVLDSTGLTILPSIPESEKKKAEIYLKGLK